MHSFIPGKKIPGEVSISILILCLYHYLDHSSYIDHFKDSMCVCICVHIYIERDRQTETQRETRDINSLEIRRQNKKQL